MKRKAILTIGAVALSVISLAHGRNTLLMLPISDVLEQKKSREILGDDIALFFGDQKPARPVGGSVGQILASATADPYVHSKKKTTIKRDDERTCREAMRNALGQLVAQARKQGGEAVVSIVSFYNKVENPSPTAYECHAGNSRAVVQLKGLVVKFAAGQ